MILISHRGNIDGKNIERENSPEYITEALNIGYDVEIDVWFKDNEYFLGHDLPQYKIDENFIKNDKLWLHAKNIEALEKLIELNVNCFFHNIDDVTLTSKGYLWTYPSKKLTKKSVAVLPETYTKEINIECAGICSDYIKKYRVSLDEVKHFRNREVIAGGNTGGSSQQHCLGGTGALVDSKVR